MTVADSITSQTSSDMCFHVVFAWHCLNGLLIKTHFPFISNPLNVLKKHLLEIGY